MSPPKRVAIIKDGNIYLYCREAIGGEYYYPVAKMRDKDQAIELVKDPQDEMIIVFLSNKRWVVTMKGADDDNIKSIRAECKTLADAQELVS